MKVEKEKVELTSETLPQLLEKLYKSQNHVLVRINGTVILDLLDLDGLKKLLITKGYVSTRNAIIQAVSRHKFMSLKLILGMIYKKSLI